MIHHPLIPPLEATAAVPWADEPHKVSGRQDCLVAFLPALLPPSLESLVRASANQPDSFAGIPEPEHDLGSPDIHATRHTGNKDIESVSNSLADFFFQSSSHHALWACSFSGLYPVNLCANSGFGDKVIDEVAAYIATANPGVKGFNRRGLYRMKQFYETYKDDEFVTPLVTQISWTNHLLILSGAKSAEERHFYMALCAKEHYSKRELERQIDSAYYERYMLSAKKLVPESVPQDVRGSILDTYVLEFLDLPEQFSERNLRNAITDNLKQFILEFGKDFTFIGEEYRIQVGGQDFYIDLLFYNRALSCLVPIELKIENFKPEHIGQINFYLEALDRAVKRPKENPSVGVILCVGKDDAVVEYALSRSMSPTLVSDYTLHLPDKKLLQNKLRELTELALESGGGDEE